MLVLIVNDLFDKKTSELSYPDHLKVCQDIDIWITKDQVNQIERDTLKQAKWHNFFKYRAGRNKAS